MVVQSSVVKGEVILKKQSQFSLETAEKSKKATYFSFRACSTQIWKEK